MRGLLELGWNDHFAAAFAEYAGPGVLPGRVALEHNHVYRVITEGGERLAEATGRLKHLAQGRSELPAVGDWVALRIDDAGDRTLIKAILPRQGKFSRKSAGDWTDEQVIAANIDTVFLVSGLDGDLNPRRIERYLLLAGQSNARPVIILNKSDLADDVAEVVAMITAMAPEVPVLELSNPDLIQQVTTAELRWRSAEAALLNRRADLSTARLQLENAVSNSKADLEQRELQYTADLELNKIGLLAALQLKQSQAAVDRAKNTLALDEKRLAQSKESERSQVAPQEADVTQLKAAHELLARNLGDLKVKAGMNGVLQVVPIELGQQVGGGTQLARVADPNRLKATIRVSETQTRDVRLGQTAEVDTRNGKVKGVVARIDPAAQNGTVGVDVTLLGPLPQGARADLSVDGTIELERLDNVLKVQRPSFSQDNATIQLYRVGADGMAIRVRVTLGVSSVAEVQVVEGLNEGDEVVLSDMANYDTYDRVRITKR